MPMMVQLALMQREEQERCNTALIVRGLGRLIQISPIYRLVVYTIQVSNNDLSCPQTGETITLVRAAPAPTFTSATPTQATECTYEKGQIALAATGGISLLQYSVDGGNYLANRRPCIHRFRKQEFTNQESEIVLKLVSKVYQM